MSKTVSTSASQSVSLYYNLPTKTDNQSVAAEVTKVIDVKTFFKFFY